MATNPTEKVKVYEEKPVRKVIPTWMWLLPLLLLVGLGLWFFNRRPEPVTTAAATTTTTSAPISDQTKPDASAGTTATGATLQATGAGAMTALGIANSIRSTGRVGFNDNDVHFATGSASLAGDSQAVLDQTAQALKANPDFKMRVVGHTDSTGSASSNAQLAQQRATSVMGYLTAHGVDQGHLSVDAKGAMEPVSTDNSDAGRAQNRRVELIKQ